jgi:hypothetical protein
LVSQASLVHNCNPYYLGSVVSWFQASVGKKTTRPGPNKKKLGTGGMAQAVEHLLCKYKNPEFKPQSHKKKKKEEEEKVGFGGSPAIPEMVESIK